jgi:prevent-host-death family protein
MPTSPSHRRKRRVSGAVKNAGNIHYIIRKNRSAWSDAVNTIINGRGKGRRMIEAMGALHISEAELVRNIASVLDRVQAGEEVVIERDSKPVAVLRAAAPRRRKLSEIAAALSKDSTAVLDAGFATDVQAFIDSHREPLNPPQWD